MASLRAHRTAPPSVKAAESDYGSDLDDSTVNELLSQAESQPRAVAPETVVASVEDSLLEDAPPTVKRAVRFTAARPQEQSRPSVAPVSPALKRTYTGPLREPSVEIEYDEQNRVAFSPEPIRDPSAEGQAIFAASTAPEQPGDDPRSPLERFRTPPKKPLSVTDFVSPAWCEQQYWYSLTKYGRVRKTKAMKQGSSVHKVLEEEVRGEAVEVTIVSNEDAFGLRIWNIIQGLRTLRATGMTRELEVWGIVDGEVVNGIIDEINTRCPDEEHEALLLEQEDDSKAKNGKKGVPLEANQQTLSSFFKSDRNASVLEDSSPWIGTLEDERARTFYLIDVKTRQANSVPADGAQVRPTHVQLMLYRRFLCSLAANEIPAEKIFQRYKNLDQHKVFSDEFIAAVSQLDFNFPDNVANEDENEVQLESSQDSVSELLAHNTLSSLWAYMIAEFARTIPNPKPLSQNLTSSSVSPLLVAEYRSARGGSLIGKKSFAYKQDALETYVQDEMQWWRGQRPTEGVDIEDAFKCRICEFAEGCSWRQEKIEEATRKSRLRKERGRRSEV